MQLRQSVARGTGDYGYLYSRVRRFPRLGLISEWKKRRPTLLNQTAVITGIWRESYGNWLGSSGSQARGKSYLASHCDTNAEPIT